MNNCYRCGKEKAPEDCCLNKPYDIHKNITEVIAHVKESDGGGSVVVARYTADPDEVLEYLNPKFIHYAPVKETEKKSPNNGRD